MNPNNIDNSARTSHEIMTFFRAAYPTTESAFVEMSKTLSESEKAVDKLMLDNAKLTHHLNGVLSENMSMRNDMNRMFFENASLRAKVLDFERQMNLMAAKKKEIAKNRSASQSKYWSELRENPTAYRKRMAQQLTGPNTKANKLIKLNNETKTNDKK